MQGPLPELRSEWMFIHVIRWWVTIRNRMRLFWTADRWSEGCFTNISRALHKNLVIIYNARNNIYCENFKLKLCTCAQSMALGTRTKLEILIRSTISAIHKFREIILECSRNVSETTPSWSKMELEPVAVDALQAVLAGVAVSDYPRAQTSPWTTAHAHRQRH